MQNLRLRGKKIKIKCSTSLKRSGHIVGRGLRIKFWFDPLGFKILLVSLKELVLDSLSCLGQSKNNSADRNLSIFVLPVKSTEQSPCIKSTKI